MNLQDLANKLISMLSVPKLAKYIAETLEELNSTKSELSKLKLQVQRYKDELQELKGEKGKPRFKKKRPRNNKELLKNKKELGEAGDRKNNKKPRKLNRIQITSEEIIKDSRIKRKKGFKNITIQDISISNNTTKYRLECGYDKDGNFIKANLPVEAFGEFGIGVLSLVKMLYYQCRVTMDKIRSTLKAFGIVIGKSVVVKMCHFLDNSLKKELDHARGSSVAKSKVVRMDDTGALVNNQNQSTFTLSTDHVTVLTTLPSKSKMSAMYAFTGGQRMFYVVDDNFFKYLGGNKYLDLLSRLRRDAPYTEDDFEKALLSITSQKNFHILYHIRVSAIRAWIQTHPPNIPHCVLVSDAAPNFNFMDDNHQLCWVHELRHYRKLDPMTEVHKQLKDQILAVLYDFYKKLKRFKKGKLSRREIELDFDNIVKIKTGYFELDSALSNTKKRKKGLLKVLKYPFVPLHNNMSEQDLRESVIKRKVSGGTKTELGTYSWDTGLSLVHTCRKLGISFYHYLLDRYSKANSIAQLKELVLEMP